MEVLYKPKILWAFAVGLGLVSLAYYASNQAEGVEQAGSLSATSPAEDTKLRAPLPVSDSDDNGIEDWREEFVSGNTLIVPTGSSSNYTIPDTLTAQAGIEMVENIIRSRNQGAFGKSREEIVAGLMTDIEASAKDTLYSMRDIIVLDNYDENTIKEYFNTTGTILRDKKDYTPVKNNELELLSKYLNGNLKSKDSLIAIAENYKVKRDEGLKTSVPKIFAKEHLDLINVYNALYKNIEAMSQVDTDPLFTLARVKRHPDDALGLVLALDHYYHIFKPYINLFSETDPGIIFLVFMPVKERALYE